jgi:hypothetical protein
VDPIGSVTDIFMESILAEELKEIVTEYITLSAEYRMLDTARILGYCLEPGYGEPSETPGSTRMASKNCRYCIYSI